MNLDYMKLSSISNKIIISLLFIIGILSTNANGNNNIEPNAKIGFQNIYIKDSITSVIDKLKAYRITNISNRLLLQNTFINPYLILSKRFNYKYSPLAMVYNINGQKYYVAFDNISINHENYSLFNIKNNNKQSKFYLNYLKLKHLNLENIQELSLINPYLKNISFFFYHDKLYKVNYNIKVDLDSFKRLFNNFKAKYGKYKYNKSDIEKTRLLWNYKNIQIIINTKSHTFKNLFKIDSVRDMPKYYHNQIVKITLTHKNIYNNILNYKSRIYRNLVDRLRQIAEQKYQQLIEVIKIEKRDNKKITRQKYKSDYKHIDNL